MPHRTAQQDLADLRALNARFILNFGQAYLVGKVELAVEVGGLNAVKINDF